MILSVFCLLMSKGIEIIRNKGRNEHSFRTVNIVTDADMYPNVCRFVLQYGNH